MFMSLSRTILQSVAMIAVFAAAVSVAQTPNLDATLHASKWNGLSLKYPSAMVSVAHDPPLGDPNVSSVMNPDILRSKDGSLEIFLSGSFNALNLIDAKSYLDQMLEWDKEGHPGTKVTYRANKGNWAVASGSRGSKIFYYKIIARCENGAAECDQPESFAIATFTYSADKRATFNKIVGAMSQTLTAAVPAN
jgi:hypothetical protein